VDDAEIEPTAKEVAVVAHGTQRDTDPGMQLLETGQTPNQPACGQCGLGGDTKFMIGISRLLRRPCYACK
jgi:hypothetical protein